MKPCSNQGSDFGSATGFQNNNIPLLSPSKSLGGRGQFQQGYKYGNLKRDMKGMWKQQNEALPKS